MRELLATFVNALLGAEADAVCGAGYGERVRRSGSTPATATGTATSTPAIGTIDVAIPKLRTGTYFPEWLLERRTPRRAGTDHGGGDLLPARRLARGGWTSWCSPWASPGCRSRRSR